MISVVYNPNGIFEQNPAKGGVCEVKDINLPATGATNNQQVIAAVTGKRIIVLSGNLASAGAAGGIGFKSATGGTVKHVYNVPANTAAPPNVPIGPIEWGVFQTATGEGLFTDNTSAAIVQISLRYIEVTP